MNRFLRGIRRPHLLCNYLIKKMSWLFTDKMYLRLRFYCELGYWLDFNNPKTFSEKLQWLKLYDRRPLVSGKKLRVIKKASFDDTLITWPNQLLCPLKETV